MSDSTAEAAVVLVLDANPQNEWHRLLRGCTLRDGRRVQAEQSEWALVHVESCDVLAGTLQLFLDAAPDAPAGSPQRAPRTRVPHFAVVRQYVRGLHGQHHLPTLSALLAAGLPAVNALPCVALNADRAAVLGELSKIARRLGPARFPLVPMRLFPPGARVHCSAGQRLPAVAKVGSSLGGWGKMRVQSAEDLADFASVAAMGADYVTLEPYVAGKVADVRVQFVGGALRSYRRVSRSWKGNVGESVVEDIAVSDAHRLWAAECAKAFGGGMDVFSVDAVVDAQGRETILELNDCCTGFMPLHYDEDMLLLRDLVLKRMNEALC